MSAIIPDDFCAWTACVVGALTLLAILAYPIALWKGSVKVRQIAAWAPFAGIALFVVLCVLVVEHGRALMHDAAFNTQLDPSLRATELANGVSLQSNGLAMLGQCLGAFMLIFLFMGLPWALRRHEAGERYWATLLTGLGAISLVSIAVVGILEWDLQVIHAFAIIASVPADDKAGSLLQTFTHAGVFLGERRNLLLYAGGVALAANCLRAVRAARAGRLVPNSIFFGSAILFVVGAAAFWATRAQAFDGAHPLADSHSGFIDAAGPMVQSCGARSTPSLMGPVVSLGKTLRLDGRVVPDYSALRDDLLTLRNNFLLLHPDEKRPDKWTVLLDGEPSAAPGPFFSALQSAAPDYQLIVLAQHPAPVDSRTLGKIDRRLSCAWTVDFAPSGRHFDNFAALADALAKSDQPLTIGP